MSFILFSNSTTFVNIKPEYDFEQTVVKDMAKIRVPTGALFMYQFGSYTRFKVPLTFVTSADKCRVESWWGANTTLYFMESGTAASVKQVKITNDTTPFSKRVKPYFNLFAGELLLETI